MIPAWEINLILWIVLASLIVVMIKAGLFGRKWWK